MNAFFIVLVVSLFSTLSPILIGYASAVAAGLYLVSRKINYLIVIFFGLIIYWPESMSGQAKFLDFAFVMYLAYGFYLFTLFFNGVNKSILKGVIGFEAYFAPILILLWLYVYLPILTHTYLGLEIFRSSDILYVSTQRSSHMLSFSLPFFLSVVGCWVLSLSAYQLRDVAPLFRVLKVSAMLYVGMSLVRYALNIDFIPQEYTMVRHDGFRLSGFANPDPNGFARSLLVVFCVIAANVLEKPTKVVGLLALLVIFIAVLMTGSRTTLISLSVGVVILFWLGLPGNKRLLALLSMFGCFGLLFFSGFAEALLYRNGATGAVLSGRSGIYFHVITILIDTPWVGLRPGGWMEYLGSNVSLVDGMIRSSVTLIDGTPLKIQSTHSFYLEIAVNWGLPMLGAMLLMSLSILGLCLRTIRDSVRVEGNLRDLRSMLIGLVALVCALHIHGVSENVPLVLYFGVLGVSVGVARNIRKELNNCTCSQLDSHSVGV